MPPGCRPLAMRATMMRAPARGTGEPTPTVQ